MPTARIFKYGRNQAVRLAAGFRVEGDEVLSPCNGPFSDWLKLRDRLLPGLSATDLEVFRSGTP